VFLRLFWGWGVSFLGISRNFVAVFFEKADFGRISKSKNPELDAIKKVKFQSDANKKDKIQSDPTKTNETLSESIFWVPSFDSIYSSISSKPIILTPSQLLRSSPLYNWNFHVIFRRLWSVHLKKSIQVFTWKLFNHALPTTFFFFFFFFF
jgi:hypothetical protein